MSSFARKLKRKNVQIKPASAITEAEYLMLEGRIKEQLVKEMFYQILAIVAQILDTDYGKLKKKDTRLDVFATAYQQKLEEFTGGPAEVAKVLEKYGLTVKWG